MAAPNNEMELEKMIRGFRVTDLQSLLLYAGRNKNGKKSELQHRALDLISLRSSAINMKVKELHHIRYNQARGAHVDSMDSMYPPPDQMTPNFQTRSSHHNIMSTPGYPGFMAPKHMLPPLMNPPPLPVNPDIRFKELPFYDILSDVVRPTTLITMPNQVLQEREFRVYLTPQQVMDLQSSLDVQIQMRFCNFDTTCEQDDEIPSTASVTVNLRTVTLPAPIQTNRPGQEGKRPKKPIDLTPFFRKNASDCNNICVTWGSSCIKTYVVAANLVRKTSSSVLIRRLKENGVRNPDHTTAMIKEKLCQDRDSEIATMSLRGSLLCPLGKVKMQLPCRALTCTHLQCFDAPSFVQMNEKKPKWICPVCDKPALFKTLAIDGLFLDIVARAPAEVTEVQFHEDGSWTSVFPQKKAEVTDTVIGVKDVSKVSETKAPKVKKKILVISLSDSDTEEDPWSAAEPPAKKKLYKIDTSPIDIGSPEPHEETSMPFDPYGPGTSKGEPGSEHLPDFIPKRSSLLPLPDSLEIVPEVDCIIGTPSLHNVPNTSSFDDVSISPKDFNMPSGSYQNPVDIVSGQSSSSSVGRNYNFDYFSLIESDPDTSYATIDEYKAGNESPDIINID